MLVPHELDELVVHRLKADRTMIAHEGCGVSRLVDVREGDHGDGARRRARNEVQRGFEDDDAGSFGADKRSRDVEPVLGQQLVEIVPGDAPGNFGIVPANKVGVAVAKRGEAAVDFALGAPRRDNPAKLRRRRAANLQAQPAIGHDVELFNIIGCTPRVNGMHAARVVAHHAAERVVIVRRGIGAKGEMMFLRRVAEDIEIAARLNARQFLFEVDPDDAVQIFREVGHDGGVARLPAQARAPAA